MCAVSTCPVFITPCKIFGFLTWMLVDIEPSGSVCNVRLYFSLPEMFVENVLLEVKGKASLVATDQTGSITLQKLLQLSSPEQVGDVLAELGGQSGSDFKTHSCDRCGGHVVESAVRQMARFCGEDVCFLCSNNKEKEPQKVVVYLWIPHLCWF